ncbi:MAG: 30S ribosomal protein S12 methylthiotransferase RimO [Ignavibacteriales bacterium]|nr:30S ribosomal protein S12 methylthiotransferase RimO [Ignavibacteriales bacterium]
MKSREHKINVLTLGCSKNTVDSERLLNQLKLNNFSISESPENADTLIINTCGFIESAKKESIDTILNAVALKNEGKLKEVMVVGCLSERYKDDLRKEIPEVDSYFGTEAYEAILKELGGELKRELIGERRLTTPAHTAYLKISEGCDHPCSFCAIPIMRGGHKSVPIEQLVKETESLAAKGVKELVIIAQDTTDYGKDIYDRRNIVELLDKLSKVVGIEWIRIMYAYPSHFPDELINEIAANPKICKYIDIPLQHISDKVLKSMRRGVTSANTKALVKKLREKIPGLTLRTTIIVGYPNETEEDFNDLIKFVEESKFDRLGVFTFSPEENTTSFPLGDPISSKEKLRRREVIMELQKEISFSNNLKFVGKKIKVLIESLEGQYYIGRSYRDAPEVDGEVLILSEGNKLDIGNFYDVEIYDNNEYDLFGKIIF